MCPSYNRNMADAKPPVVAELIWSTGLRFGATTGTIATVVDGDSTAGPSPVQMVVIGLAGCMAIDLADILRKGRHSFDALRVTVTAERAPEPPRRLVSASLRFHVRGNAPAAAVERAIALSREKYCSVWHSLRPDIELTTGYDLVP